MGESLIENEYDMMAKTSKDLVTNSGGERGGRRGELIGEVAATNKICEVPSIRINQKIVIPVKEIDTVIKKVKHTVQDRNMKERGNTMTSMNLGIRKKY